MRGYSLPLAPLATPGGTSRVIDPKVTTVPVIVGGCPEGVSVAGTSLGGKRVEETGISELSPAVGIMVLAGRLVTVAIGPQAENRSDPAKRAGSSFKAIMDCVLAYINILLLMSNTIKVIQGDSIVTHLWGSLCPGHVDR